MHQGGSTHIRIICLFNLIASRVLGYSLQGVPSFFDCIIIFLTLLKEENLLIVFICLQKLVKYSNCIYMCTKAGHCSV